MEFEHLTLESAYRALEDMAADAKGDNPDITDDYYADLVDSVALSCDPAIRAELYRTTGCQPRGDVARLLGMIQGG